MKCSVEDELKVTSPLFAVGKVKLEVYFKVPPAHTQPVSAEIKAEAEMLNLGVGGRGPFPGRGNCLSCVWGMWGSLLSFPPKRCWAHSGCHHFIFLQLQQAVCGVKQELWLVHWPSSQAWERRAFLTPFHRRSLHTGAPLGPTGFALADPLAWDVYLSGLSPERVCEDPPECTAGG